MDISAELAADLAALSVTLDGGGPDLDAELRALTIDVTRTVESFLGMTVVIDLDDHELTFTVHHAPAGAPAPASSLLIPLPAVTFIGTGSRLVLYAATPRAFVELAADLAYVLPREATGLVLDRNLVEPPASNRIAGLAELSAFNRAIGVLIAAGHTAESADHELHHLAGRDHVSVDASAIAVLDDLARARRRPAAWFRSRSRR